MSGRVIHYAKLAAVLRMLGSAHDGEALTAGRPAERMRAAAGLTWIEIVSAPPPTPRPVQSLAAAINLALDHPEVLSNWEYRFVTSISRADYPSSERQLEILQRIMQKARRAEARAA